MKRVILFGGIVLCLSILLSLFSSPPAQAQPATKTPAYYASDWYSEVIYDTPTRVYNFRTVENGVVRLTEDVFIPEVTGLLKVSAHCETKLPNVELHMRLSPLERPSFGRVYNVHGEGFAEFSIPFPAEPFEIEAWQDNPGGARGKCAVLVEQVK